MAINKNFVVKNGLEVNTSLIVADSENSRVGVATTSPDYLLHVNGGIGATNLTVTGLSTFSGISTFQSGFFVNGISTHIGVGTFQDNVFIEGQLFNSDTTENTLGDVDSGSVQLDGGLGVAKNTTIGAGLSVLDGLTVVGLSTFVGIVTTSSDLFVGGDLFIKDDLVLDTNLNILGIATIGRLHVTGIGTIDGDARVGGALTVTSSVDFNDDLDVDGHTELDELNVSGISTFASAVDINDDLDVDGHTELDNLNVSGLSTFVGFSTFNDSVFIQSNLSVGGITTSNSYTIDGTTVITSGRELQNIASLDATTTATIESAIASGPNTFDDLKITGISTFIGIATFGSGVGIADSIFHLEDNTTSFRFPSDGTFTVEATGTERLRVNENGVNIAGLITASSGGKFNQVDVGKSNINGITGDVNLTLDAGAGAGGAVIIASDVGLQASHNLIVSGITTLGIASATNFTADNVNVSLATTTNILAVTGIATAETLQVGNLGLSVTGITTLGIASATNFTADSVIVGSAVTINNTGVNVAGVTTTGKLVVNSDFDVFDAQAVFHNNVLINGTLSIGGTTTVIAAQDLIVANKDIVLGYTTNITNDDVSNDNTSNHGGIAVASTVGTPLVPFKVTGINTFPDTYKQIMWVKSGTYSGLGTDAWLFNYGVGIGSTQFPNGVRLAVSQIQMTDNSINAANFVGTNINASGITSTNSLNIGATQVINSSRELQNIASLDATTTATIEAAIAAGPNTFDDLKVTGITTLGFTTATDFGADNINITGVTTLATFTATSGVVGSAVTVDSSGIDVTGVVTATSFVGDGSQLTNTGAALTTSSAVLRILSTSLTSGIVTSAVAEAELTYDAATNVLNVNGGLNVTSGVSTLTSAVVGSAVSIADYGIHATGVVTATGGFNIGIQSASGEVTTGVITALNFIGAGNTFAYNASTKTVDISIAGNVGGGGTWQTYTAGIATSKSVGVNTSNLDNSNLTGVGDSFQGLYIGNGMLIVDNALNGDHYIGTNFNGLMAGPVTVNGTLTIDGNWVVV